MTAGFRSPKTKVLRGGFSTGGVERRWYRRVKDGRAVPQPSYSEGVSSISCCEEKEPEPASIMVHGFTMKSKKSPR